ncbi:hypothetical protein ACDZ28_16365 [Paenibacillus sp. RS8]|uniref:hypothetical protein n=1 Tax=Paenibacillus sp. RS8 TaxID=3242681 RepID=UPI0035C02C69
MAFHRAGSFLNKTFPGKLGFMSGFYPDIFPFHLMKLAMHIAPCLIMSNPPGRLDGAGLLLRLLGIRFFAGAVQLVVALFHAFAALCGLFNGLASPRRIPDIRVRRRGVITP